GAAPPAPNLRWAGQGRCFVPAPLPPPLPPSLPFGPSWEPGVPLPRQLPAGPAAATGDGANPPQTGWHRSATADEKSRILSYNPATSPPQTPGPAHTGRETAGPSCALNIAGLTLSDTGNYTVLIMNPGVLTIPPTVTPNQTQVLENGTFTLTCNSSPSVNTMLWLRDGASLVPSERLVLSPDNWTLTVLGVTRGDAGAYQCEVGNPVSTNRSEPSNVTVAYGPDSAQIDPPGPIALTLGSLLKLTCVADSVPAPSYRWLLNDTDTKETGSSLTFNLTTWAQQGTYECWTHNPVTGRTAWASVVVWVTGTGESPGWTLSAGAVAGIVIGSLAGAALVGVTVYFLCE
uniref:Ig-like domain-containing protein n=1 Tax=Chrysemys picta bellii TaxID=8478 RepID=A0A8C3FSP7_CHRPI